VSDPNPSPGPYDYSDNEGASKSGAEFRLQASGLGLQEGRLASLTSGGLLRLVLSRSLKPEA
jgi:hypothetical protein